MAKIILFSGAGISAPSGISTFRDSDGLWKNHKIDEICNIQTWKHHFNKVHEFYNKRRIQLNSVEPNTAHKKVADWEERYNNNFINITQNIDNLFEKAGCKEVIHLHGNLLKMQCYACGKVWDIDTVEWNPEEDRCPRKRCNSKKGVKPAVVFFGESAPEYQKLHKALYDIEEGDIIIVIGTMGAVINIADFIYEVKKSTKNVTAILNNMEYSEYINEDVFDYIFYESVETAIDKIDDIIKGHTAFNS